MGFKYSVMYDGAVLEVTMRPKICTWSNWYFMPLKNDLRWPFLGFYTACAIRSHLSIYVLCQIPLTYHPVPDIAFLKSAVWLVFIIQLDYASK